MNARSDEMVAKGFFPGQVYPRVPGHEIVGEVVATGTGEQLWKVGDRVGAGWHGGHCGSCTRCRIGDFVTCSISGTCPTGEYVPPTQDTSTHLAVFAQASAEMAVTQSTRL